MSSNRITILHDSFGRRADLRKDWGFSALIEFGGGRILFDAGNDARTFAENTDSLGIDLRSLDFAVISHRHGDHTSGLNHLLKLNPAIGVFYPRRPALPVHMQYYNGHPPETIRHGTPWPGARFAWITETTELVPDVWAVSVVSDVPGTREMRELSLALRTSNGLVLVAGCSHPGIERILAASRSVHDRVDAIFGGLHLVLTDEVEVQRIAYALRDDWRVRQIAPGHCTGEPAFLALSEAFGNRYVYAGLGDSVDLP